MEPRIQSRPTELSPTALAIVLDGVSERWQMNVLQILGCPTIEQVNVDGHGTVEALAIRLTQDQARHLATQITELLGPETRNTPSHMVTL